MAANKEKLKKLNGELRPEKKESLLEEIFDDIGNDVEGFFTEVRDWITGEKPVVQKIENAMRYTWKNHTKNQVVQPLMIWSYGRNPIVQRSTRRYKSRRMSA